MRSVTIHSVLAAADVEAVARHAAPVDIAPEVDERMAASRAHVDAVLDRGVPVYGINTGFGSLSRQRIDRDKLAELQTNLVRSHASGMAEPLPEMVVRGMMLVLAASLARGQSGARPEIVHLIKDMLNAGVTPVVPSIGSVGASGDLAPLAHVAQVLIGEGRATIQGTELPGGEALARVSLVPLTLLPKEGLALLNGTHLMAAELALLMQRSDRLFAAAVAATAMSIDGCRASTSFLDERLYIARAQPGPRRAAALLRSMLEASQIVDSHRENDPRVQDPYSLRCAAMVIGAVVDLFDEVRRRAHSELQAVTDNPLVFDNGDIVSGGNFHGMPVALPLDTLALGVAHLAGIAERRTYHMVSSFDEESHLSPFLSPLPGLHSGYMIAQYAAAAACNEIAQLAAPASVYNLSTCAGMEDYNSFGPRSAAKARRAFDLCERVIAIELMCAAQAMDAHRPLRSGEGVEEAHAVVREVVAPLVMDRSPAPDIEAIATRINDGAFVGIIERAEAKTLEGGSQP